MAQTKGGVAGFVHRHEQGDQTAENEQPPPPLQASKSMDDLKVPPSASRKKVAANANASRAADRPVARPPTGKQLKMENDTDFSSIEGTERPEYETAEHNQHEHDESSDFPNDPLRQPQQHNDNGRSVHERTSEHPGHSAFAHQQIKGDSYPPTTDGDPSVADQPEGIPPYSTQPPANDHQMKSNGALPTRGGGAGGTRVPLNVSHRPQNPGQQNHNSHADPAFRHVQIPYGAPNFNVNNVVADANAAFKRLPGTKSGGSRPPAPAPAPTQPLQSVGAAPQGHSAPTHVAQRGPPSMANMSSHQDRAQRHGPGLQQKVAAQPQGHQRHFERPPQRPLTHPQPMTTAEPAQLQNPRATPLQRPELTFRTVENDDLPAGSSRQRYKYRESSYDVEEPIGEEADGQPDEEPDDESDDEPDNLDYEEEAIYKMAYSTLKAESFDLDPQAEDLELPEVQQHHTLEAKLQAVSGLPSRVQNAFFTSLSVEQWEEAGDWFLEQFGAVLKKFKAARQAKRKAAKEFEDEIEKRHEAVSKKRKLTEDALSEMKKTGSVVLQGTPNKSKKTM